MHVLRNETAYIANFSFIGALRTRNIAALSDALVNDDVRVLLACAHDLRKRTIVSMHSTMRFAWRSCGATALCMEPNSLCTR